MSLPRGWCGTRRTGFFLFFFLFWFWLLEFALPTVLVVLNLQEAKTGSGPHLALLVILRLHRLISASHESPLGLCESHERGRSFEYMYIGTGTSVHVRPVRNHACYMYKYQVDGAISISATQTGSNTFDTCSMRVHKHPPA